MSTQHKTKLPIKRISRVVKRLDFLARIHWICLPKNDSRGILIYILRNLIVSVSWEAKQLKRSILAKPSFRFAATAECTTP